MHWFVNGCSGCGFGCSFIGSVFSVSNLAMDDMIVVLSQGCWGILVQLCCFSGAVFRRFCVGFARDSVGFWPVVVAVVFLREEVSGCAQRSPKCQRSTRINHLPSQGTLPTFGVRQ